MYIADYSNKFMCRMFSGMIATESCGRPWKVKESKKEALVPKLSAAFRSFLLRSVAVNPPASVPFGFGGVLKIGIVKFFFLFKEIPVLYRFPHYPGLPDKEPQVVDGKQAARQEFFRFEKMG